MERYNSEVQDTTHRSIYERLDSENLLHHASVPWPADLKDQVSFNIAISAVVSLLFETT